MKPLLRAMFQTFPDDNIFSNGDVGPITRELYDILTGIQYGNDRDPFGWILEL